MGSPQAGVQGEVPGEGTWEMGSLQNQDVSPSQKLSGPRKPLFLGPLRTQPPAAPGFVVQRPQHEPGPAYHRAPSRRALGHNQENANLPFCLYLLGNM